MSHPLESSLTTLGEMNDYLRIQIGEPKGEKWHTPERFFTPTLFDEQKQRAQVEYRTESPTLLANLILSDYRWIAISSVLTCYLLDGRVPALDNIRVHCDEEALYADQIAFVTGRFATLPDDPAADHPDVIVLSNRRVLRKHLRLIIEGHMAYVMGLLCQRLDVQPRSLWPGVADRCAGTIIWFGQQIGMDNKQIIEEVEGFVNVPASPLNNPITGLLPTTVNGHTRFVLKRAACCQAYRRGHDHGCCNTCPRIPEADRITRLQHLMREQV